MSIPSQPVSADPFDPEWFQAARGGLADADAAILREAADWVREPLRGARASTGEALDAHAAAVVLILRNLDSDAPTRAAALLAVQPVPAGELARAGIVSS